jgi:AmmeMemoRadiSam system protein B
VGVFHAARLWNLHDVVVFDDFDAWHGPWGPVKVDDLRQDVINALDDGSYVVDNAMHCREHSLEAIVPFLQQRNRDVTIVPVLVPYMGWDRIDHLTSEMSAALTDIMKDRGWRLGRDIAIVISSDAIHYGEDFDHAPFGSDGEAHAVAVARDKRLVRDHLEGALDPVRLESLLEDLVDPEDLRRYRIPWCGRFSVPFGLELLRKVSLATTGETPRGSLLNYGTSVSQPELPVNPSTREAGLGYTAPSNFHHWVGYAAIGYTISD